MRTRDSPDALRDALGAVFGIAVPDEAESALREAVARTSANSTRRQRRSTNGNDCSLESLPFVRFVLPSC